MEPIVSMTGRLGTEVEERTTRQGVRYVSFRMASTSRFQREGHWVDGPTTWVSVRCYRQLAHHVSLSLRKGQPVVVTGRLRTESWQDQAGNNRERTVLEAQAIGHDLTWGATVFNRVVKDVPPAEREAAELDQFHDSGQAESGQADSGQADSEQADSEQTGSVWTRQGQPESGSADASSETTQEVAA